MKGYTAIFEKRMWVIYKITNPDGQNYVGKTCDFHNRMSSYRNGRCSKQRLLDESFIKYGFDEHSIEILDTFFSDKEYAKGKEIFWIRTCMTNVSKYPEQRGLNLTDGFGGLGVFFSEERKERQRIRMTGQPTSDYQKQRAREVHKGNKYNLGRKPSLESIEKTRLKNTGQKRTKEQIEGYKIAQRKSRGIPIVQVDDNGITINVFNSKQEAIETLKLSEPTINRLLGDKPSKYKWGRSKGINLAYLKSPSFDKTTFQRRVFKQQEIKTA